MSVNEVDSQSGSKSYALRRRLAGISCRTVVRMPFTSKHRRWAPIVGAVLVVASVASWAIRDARADRDPARVYSRYSSELAAYAERLQTGRVPRDSNGEYAMPQFLIDRGATHVRREGECFVITFGFMPSDAVPELWFSPTGFDPLPKELAERKHHPYFRFVQLSDEWAECDWDM